MSWHCENLRCTECDLNVPFPHADRHYKYVTERGEAIPLNSAACYCWDCEKFTLCEHFTSEWFLSSDYAKNQGRRFEEQIDLLCYALQKEMENTRTSSNNLYARQRLISVITNFIELDSYSEFLSARKTSERCLTCGGARIDKVLRDKFSEELQRDSEEDNCVRISEIMHPKCGGKLFLETEVSGIHFQEHIYAARLFNLEGDDLECELDPQKLAEQKSARDDAELQKLLDEINK